MINLKYTFCRECAWQLLGNWHSLTKRSKGQGYVQYMVIKCADGICMSIRQLGFSNYKWVFLLRDAMLAQYMPSSCMSVCLSVSITLQYCIKTAKRRITQIMLHDSSRTPVFWRHGEIWTGSAYGGDKCKWGWVKIGHYRRKMRYNLKKVGLQDRRIVSIKVE